MTKDASAGDALQVIAPSHQVTRGRVLSFTVLAMVAFAANSLLCRLALTATTIDPASFTGIRLVAGAIVLALIARLGDAARPLRGTWPSALALFAYAAAFSFAYVQLTAATGALLLFGSVQATMLGYGAWRGERLGVRQAVGLAAASLGLVALLLPGLSAPPPGSASLMIAAGIAWGMYSLRGRGNDDPLRVTAGNFVFAVPFAIALSLAASRFAHIDAAGVLYAIASGAVASGVGYAIWYNAVRGLTATSAATVQLSVPVIAALGGVALLGEHVTLRLAITSVIILGGVALAIVPKKKVEG